MSMFHVKQYKVNELVYLLFLISLPFQTRILFNADTSYIGSVFSYHKAIFLYLSDLLFIAFILPWLIFEKTDYKGLFYALLPAGLSGLLLFHVERLDLGIYNCFKITEFWLLILYVSKKSHLKHISMLVLILGGIFQGLLAGLQFHVQHSLNLGFLGEYVPDLKQLGTATLNSESGKIIRAYGTFPHPNVLGGYLAVILGLLCYVSRETKKNLNLLMVSCGTMILAWGLTVSFSRSAWIAAALLSIVFIAYQIGRKAYRQALIWASFLLFSALLMIGIYNQIVFPRSKDIGAESEAYSYRKMFNTMGINVFNRNPVMGAGPGQIIPIYEEMFHVEPWQYQLPHNILLLILAEFGILGLLTRFLALRQLGFTWNNIDKTLFFIIVPVIFAIGSLDHFLLSIQQGFLIFALILGLMINKKDVSQIRETSMLEK